MTYRNKLLSYFTAIFFVFAMLVVGFQWQYERYFKRQMFENRLATYCDLVAGLSTKSIKEMARDVYLLYRVFPEDLRISLINLDTGQVFFDNKIPDSNGSQHADRPEVSKAIKKGNGSDIRISSTLGSQMFYYAERYDKFVVRVAMPYDEATRVLLTPGRIVIFFILILLPLAICGIIYTARRFGKSIENLKKFVDSAEKGLVDYNHIEFPDTELGNISSKVVKVYRKAEERREEVEKEKRNKQLYKQQMSNNITHELRTPVAAIQGYLETIDSNPGIPPETSRHFIHRSLVQSKRLSMLVRDLSLITKMEETPDLIKKEPVVLTDIVEEVMSDMHVAAEEKAVSMVNSIPRELVVCGNDSLLYSIFCNLYENSIKYASPCVCKVELVLETSEIAELRFSDNGGGSELSESQLNDLFNRFYRVDEGRTRSSGGTGLGLSIVKNAVQVHGGSIKAENMPGGGLGFSFTLKKGSAHSA